jgi:hypothetical protein
LAFHLIHVSLLCHVTTWISFSSKWQRLLPSSALFSTRLRITRCLVPQEVRDWVWHRLLAPCQDGNGLKSVI